MRLARYLLLPLLAQSTYGWAAPIAQGPGLLVAAQAVGAPLPPVAANVPPSPVRSQSAVPMSLVEDKLDDLSRRVILLSDQLRNQGLLNMHNQLQALKTELAKLRGAQEELAHAQQLADKRQKELFADLDGRLKELARKPAPAPSEPVRPQAGPNPPPPVTPAPAEMESDTKTYETALNHFKSADYVAAVSAFNAYIVKYPDGALASNALYWLGLAYYALADYKSAVEAQKRLLKDFPNSNKVPDATLSLARAQVQLGATEDARQSLEQVVSQFPSARAADTARKMLTLFK